MPSERPPVTLPNSEVHILESSIVDDTYNLNIVLPAEYARSTARYPVVYVTDGNYNVFTVWQLADSLTMSRELPPLIIVGIGYATNDPIEMFVRRSRDYNPTPDEEHDRRYLEQFGLETIQTGGADKFLRFIREELKPFIISNYRSDPEKSTYVGHSGGGLFGLYTLFNHPDTFHRYVIVSPTIFRGNRAILVDEHNYAEQHDDLPARVFLAVGAREETDDPIANRFDGDVLSSLQMISNVRNLTEILRERDYPNLAVTTSVIDDETHLSVFPAACSRGLREVLE